MFRKTLNNKGVALVTVVLFFLVLVILLGGVMFSSISNQGNAKLSKDHTSAYYVAESGMNITIEKIKEHLVNNNFIKFLPSDSLAAKKAELRAYLTNTSNWPPVTLSGLNPTGMFSVLITDSAGEQFTVSVTGEVNDVSRTIQGTFSYETILEPTEVKFNSFTIPSYPLKADLKQVAFSNNKITFPNLDGKLGYYIDSLPTTPFEIDTGTGNGTIDPIKLYVLDVSTSSNGTTNIGNITVTGSDQVMVHITIDSTDTSGSPKYYFSWASNVNVGQTDMTKFQLVIRKGVGFSSGIDPVFTIPNGNTFVGSVLMDYVNIELKNMTFVGFIGTLGTTITTGSNGTISGPMWVYAPNAVVDMSSGITIKGSIMASSVSLNSGATIIYDPFEGQVPFELNLPIFMGGKMAPVGIKFKFINFKEV